MSRFTQELKVVPRAAWIIGALVYLSITTPIFLVELPTDPNFRDWPRWGQALFVYGIMLLVIPFFGLFGYIWGDAKRRGMRYVMWTLLAIFVPYLIGVIVYFLLRDPLPKACSGCGNMVKSGFVFCPHCGTTLQPTCPNCGKAVETGWANCPHCGQSLPSKAPRAA